MRKNRNRRSWTQAQKRTIAAEATRRRAAGESFKTITEALGVLEGSLRLWMSQHEERAIQPVEVVDVAFDRSQIALVTPDGFRFEGIDVESALLLLGRLR